ncbi:MAG: FAD-dependent oxidoreductase [Armatimonadetes bacterium CG2_30_59_28]|nr:NAD(P)/FAD-dependent oxidoreductase [Armatimonadota bacterium]OIO92137.1 MAG: FAD-dependent oxidoreductase [Armatimonadetes bacterium CG2_30_59_28]PIU65589.1 MAG: FAD-dependent oxidoreductase [Armatimonadetes bacterium CG07_land_8_20_14_0_80_59_28]PIX44373.1 MAG: FAD-dependent oxidoreductase [Armatimonadetes bacterium CG_4_8_14_3_um_filter_58_9]PIY39217.1 MAG: FAD-dependent oxidoreductase [Armatimonadetes bacterium CG_4_10_14_3_um_filter_59_10]PJB62852.1 MAG: FAD-dependent oxidoreductase [A
MDNHVVVIGGGPAGLAAAYEMTRQQLNATVLERDAVPGGLSRTVQYKGYSFDIGGHRFFTKVPEVDQMWDEILGEAFLIRPRLSRIYYNNRFFHYPLRPLEALRNLGPAESARILSSFFSARLFPKRPEDNLEAWVANRFGHRLYSLFFKTYTEKVWGIPCSEIGADWAAQRIKNLSLSAALRSSLFKQRGEVITTLIDEFRYPRLGPGMMWNRCMQIVMERGQRVELGQEVVAIRHADWQVRAVETASDSHPRREHEGTDFISSMALQDLILSLVPSPPDSVLECARSLRYRDFLTVALIVDQPDLFPDNWIYVHSPAVRVGRIQNYKNWSPEMVPDPQKSCLGLEYFVSQNDDLWNRSDQELIELGTAELASLGLVQPAWVEDGAVVRVLKAYPVYDTGYQKRIESLKAYLSEFRNLQCCGRNGLHRYNNQDHSMLTAMLAVRNLIGEKHNVWDVNTEDEYHETFTRRDPVPVGR